MKSLKNLIKPFVPDRLLRAHRAFVGGGDPGRPDWRRDWVGGMGEEVGKLRFDFFVRADSSPTIIFWTLDAEACVEACISSAFLSPATTPAWTRKKNFSKRGG